MNEIIINDKPLPIREYKGNRVVTFKEIDEVHERKGGTARRNFYTNKERFIEGIDFFKVKCSEVCTKFVHTPNGFNPNADLILITESGYLMLVKSFTDDLAWKVQRELVNNYFRGKAPILDLPTEDTKPQAAYTGAQRLGDVVELAKLTARLMKDSKRVPADILHTVGAQLESFGVVMPDGFYMGGFSSDAAIERSKVVSQFLSEFGSVLDMSVGEVYNEYVDYCRRTGDVPISSTYTFGREVVKHTGAKTKTAHHNGKVMRVYTDG